MLNEDIAYYCHEQKENLATQKTRKVISSRICVLAGY